MRLSLRLRSFDCAQDRSGQAETTRRCLSEGPHAPSVAVASGPPLLAVARAVHSSRSIAVWSLCAVSCHSERSVTE